MNNGHDWREDAVIFVDIRRYCGGARNSKVVVDMKCPKAPKEDVEDRGDGAE